MNVLRLTAGFILTMPWLFGITAIVGGEDARRIEWSPTLPTATVTETITVPATTAPERITEDSGKWDCRTRGNRVCGPTKSGPKAGCYRGGVLVIPWTNYTNPKLDPLWGQVISPC